MCHNKTPRYFILSVSFISVLSTFKVFVLHLSNWGFYLKRMNSVLLLFILSLFSFIHTFRSVADFSSSSIHLTSSLQSLGLNLFPTVWSSAKPCRVRGGFTMSCIELQYMLKSCAPVQEPCGMLKGSGLMNNLFQYLLYLL